MAADGASCPGNDLAAPPAVCENSHPASNPKRYLKDFEEVQRILGKYKETHLLLGFGSRLQFDDIDDVLSAMDSTLQDIKDRAGEQGWLLMYGGDTPNEDKPCVGLLAQRVKEKYGCLVMAPTLNLVDKECKPPAFVDYVYKVEPDYQEEPTEQPAAATSVTTTDESEEAVDKAAGAGSGVGGANLRKRDLEATFFTDGEDKASCTAQRQRLEDNAKVDGEAAAGGAAVQSAMSPSVGVTAASEGEEGATVPPAVGSADIGNGAALASCESGIIHADAGGNSVSAGASGGSSDGASDGKSKSGASGGGMRSIIWGGVYGDPPRPLGPSKLYLDDRLLRSGPGPCLTSVLVAGGGEVARKELDYAASRKVRWEYFRSRARWDSCGEYGEKGGVEEWYQQQPCQGRLSCCDDADGAERAE